MCNFVKVYAKTSNALDWGTEWREWKTFWRVSKYQWFDIDGMIIMDFNSDDIATRDIKQQKWCYGEFDSDDIAHRDEKQQDSNDIDPREIRLMPIDL